MLREAVTWSGKLGHVSGYRECYFVFFGYWLFVHASITACIQGAVDAAAYSTWVFGRFILG